MQRTYIDFMESLVLLSLVFYLFELLIPAERTQTILNRVGNWIYVTVVVVWALAFNLIVTPLYTFFITAGHGGILSPLRAIRPGLVTDLLLTLVFAVLWDVWQYGMHRWQHSSAVLWETHKFHHSDTRLNAGSHARHHAMHHVLYGVGYAPMLLIFGGFGPHAIGAFVMYKLWGFVNHANLRIGFGPLVMVLASPQWHRIHHSIEAEHRDRNFATLFPFIDRLFGTYYQPAPEEFPPTGLPTDNGSLIRQATIEPFVAWYRATRRQPQLAPAGVAELRDSSRAATP